MPFELSLGKVYEVKVLGAYGGQQVVNVFNLYTGTGSIDPAGPANSNDVLVAWRTRWRAQVLPNVVFPYQVKEYAITEVTSVTMVPASGTRPAYYRLDYGATDLLVGDPFLDQSARVSAPQPTFSAVSVRVVAITLAGKRVRGAKRFGPIAESDTVDSPGGQVLAGAVFNAWQAASVVLYSTLVALHGAVANNIDNVILSRAWADLGGHNPVNGVGIIQDVVCHELIGSQVSRKARFGGA